MIFEEEAPKVSMITVINETSQNALVNNSNYRNGIPNWDNVTPGWESAWITYIYLFSTAYIIILGYSALLYVKFQKRLVREKLQFLLLLFVAFTSLLLSIFHISDPYGYYSRIPNVIMRIIWKFPNVLLVGAYCLVQMIIMKLTRLDIPSIHCNGFRFLIFMSSFYSVEIIFVEVFLNIYPFYEELTFLSEGIFIAYTLYLSLCFIYGAPTIAKYTEQAEKAKKELSAHSLSRLDTGNQIDKGRNKPRIKHPRIRTTTSGNRISLLSDDESSCSDCNRDSPLSERKKGNKNENDNFYMKRRIKAINSKTFCNGKRQKENLHCPLELKDGSILSNSRASSISSHGDESSPNMEVKTQQRNSLRHSSSHDVISIATIRNNFFRESLISLPNQHFISNTIRRESDSRQSSNEQSGIVLNPSALLSNEMKVLESGYIADSERFSIQSEDNDTIRFGDTKRRISKESSTGMSLPNSSSFLCFQRLRQGRMLKFLIRFAYCVTALIVLCGIGGIYNIYRLYKGVILNQPTQLVPWLVYQYYQRFVEMLILLLLTMAVHTLLSFRSQRTGKRRIRKVRDSSVSVTPDRGH